MPDTQAELLRRSENKKESAKGLTELEGRVRTPLLELLGRLRVHRECTSKHDSFTQMVFTLVLKDADSGIKVH